MKLAFLVLTLAALTSLTAKAASPLKLVSCYSRTYSAQHLAKNPDQIARAIKVAIATDEYKNNYAIVSITQRNTDVSWIASVTADCPTKVKGKYSCSVAMDQGEFTFAVKGKAATLTVSTFLTLEGFDPSTEEVESMHLDAGKTDGIYNLNVASSASCKGLI